MRGKKDNSDRERLLKLIDGDQGALKEIRKRNWLKAASRVFNEIIFFFKPGPQGAFQKLRKGEFPLASLKMTALSKVLIVILIIMFSYLIFDFIGSTLFRKTNMSIPAEEAAPKVVQEARRPALNNYLNETSGKDIFNPQRITQVEHKEPAVVEGGSGNAGIPAAPVPAPISPGATLKLAGVDWSEDPVAMIEDTRTQKTFFVKKGQFVNEFEVMEISRGSVKLKFENKMIDLQ